MYIEYSLTRVYQLGSHPPSALDETPILSPLLCAGTAVVFFTGIAGIRQKGYAVGVFKACHSWGEHIQQVLAEWRTSFLEYIVLRSFFDKSRTYIITMILGDIFSGCINFQEKFWENFPKIPGIKIAVTSAWPSVKKTELHPAHPSVVKTILKHPQMLSNGGFLPQ